MDFVEDCSGDSNVIAAVAAEVASSTSGVTERAIAAAVVAASLAVDINLSIFFSAWTFDGKISSSNGSRFEDETEEPAEDAKLLLWGMTNRFEAEARFLAGDGGLSLGTIIDCGSCIFWCCRLLGFLLVSSRCTIGRGR